MILTVCDYIKVHKERGAASSLTCFDLIESCEEMRRFGFCSCTLRGGSAARSMRQEKISKNTQARLLTRSLPIPLAPHRHPPPMAATDTTPPLLMLPPVLMTHIVLHPEPHEIIVAAQALTTRHPALACLDGEEGAGDHGLWTQAVALKRFTCAAEWYGLLHREKGQQGQRRFLRESMGFSVWLTADRWFYVERGLEGWSFSEGRWTPPTGERPTKATFLLSATPSAAHTKARHTRHRGSASAAATSCATRVAAAAPSRGAAPVRSAPTASSVSGSGRGSGGSAKTSARPTNPICCSAATSARCRGARTASSTPPPRPCGRAVSATNRAAARTRRAGRAAAARAGVWRSATARIASRTPRGSPLSFVTITATAR